MQMARIDLIGWLSSRVGFLRYCADSKAPRAGERTMINQKSRLKHSSASCRLLRDLRNSSLGWRRAQKSSDEPVRMQAHARLLLAAAAAAAAQQRPYFYCLFWTCCFLPAASYGHLPESRIFDSLAIPYKRADQRTDLQDWSRKPSEETKSGSHPVRRC